MNIKEGRFQIVSQVAEQSRVRKEGNSKRPIASSESVVPVKSGVIYQAEMSKDMSSALLESYGIPKIERPVKPANLILFSYEHKKTVAGLRADKRYTGLSDYVISFAAWEEDPVAFLNKLQKDDRALRKSKEYSGADQQAMDLALTMNPDNPGPFLDKLLAEPPLTKEEAKVLGDKKAVGKERKEKAKSVRLNHLFNSGQFGKNVIV